jgi:hypothetical protein
MSAMQVVQHYFDTWNGRDVGAIVATFAEGGTYSDPQGGQGLRGEALANYANGLWQAFPDLSFEMISAAEAGAGEVLQLCSHPVVGWLHAPPGVFGLLSIQMAPV